MGTPKPLKKRMMTLSQLQLKTLDVLRRVKFQFDRQAHDEGMSDGEFIDQVVDPLMTDIYQDRQMQKLNRENHRD